MKNILLYLFVFLIGGIVATKAQNNFSNYSKTETITMFDETQEPTYHNGVVVTPNPVSSYLRITFPKDIQEEVFFSVSNSSGEVIIADQQIKPSLKNFIHLLPVEDFKPGAYVLKIRDGNERIFKRFEVR